MKIILVGYMGSGKSIIAQELSKSLNIKFEDLDILIEESQKMSIKNIFSEKGELFFRKLEHQIFQDITAQTDSLILSTGGGTPCYFNNHELLNFANCRSIYLKASIETLFKRLQFEKEKRPLIANLSDSNAKEFIAKQLFERNYYYRMATFAVDVNDKSVATIVKEIEILLM